MGQKSLWQAAIDLRPSDVPNVKCAVPFLGVRDIEASLHFYERGLGFTMTRNWAPDGRVRCCWLRARRRCTDAAGVLEEGEHGNSPGPPEGPMGQGVSICFMCGDAIAIYREAHARGLQPCRPFVGNNMWVTWLTDPDGYRLEFESPTDVAEDTVYAD
jgi:lactoylglutathione lyase